MDRRAVLERQRTIHISFGGLELGIEEQLEVELAVAQVDGDVGPRRAIAEYMLFAVGIADPQGALVNETPKQIGQQSHVGSVALRDSAASEK